MQVRKFPLVGILQIRRYNESRSLQIFLEETKRDRVLAAEFEQLEQTISTIISVVGKGYKSLDDMRYTNDFLSSCRNRQFSINTQREAMKDTMKISKDKYNIARLELESIKILEKKHNKQQYKLRVKLFETEIRERVVCQK